MKRQIVNLNEYAYGYLRNEVPRAIKSESVDLESRTATVTLNDSVILKSYDDGVFIEIGINKAELLEEDFESIAIAR